MLYELPAICPVCKKTFHVKRLGCENCGCTLDGAFELDRLSQLSTEMRRFVVIFLKSRGNIREMEKFYGISYPTVRSRLDEIVAALDGQSAATVTGDSSFGGETGDKRTTDGDGKTDDKLTADGAQGNNVEDGETENGYGEILYNTENISGAYALRDNESDINASLENEDDINASSEAESKDKAAPETGSVGNASPEAEGAEFSVAATGTGAGGLSRLTILKMLANGEVDTNKARELLNALNAKKGEK